jgi:hypothetical protein
MIKFICMAYVPLAYGDSLCFHVFKIRNDRPSSSVILRSFYADIAPYF